MAEIYRGNRSYYEEHGRLYNNESKSIEYDIVTSEPLSVTVARPTESASIVVTQIEAPITQTVISANELRCDECGFEAKSNAGLAVHKLRHKGHNENSIS